MLIAEPDLQKAGQALIQKALDRDGPDNITVVLARFDGEGLQAAGARGRRLLRPPTTRAATRCRSRWAAPRLRQPGARDRRGTAAPDMLTADDIPTKAEPDEPEPTEGRRTRERPRSGRSLLALFLLALVAAATGGIFVMKCEHDPTRRSHPPLMPVREWPPAHTARTKSRTARGSAGSAAGRNADRRRPPSPRARRPWPRHWLVRAAAAVGGADAGSPSPPSAPAAAPAPPRPQSAPAPAPARATGAAAAAPHRRSGRGRAAAVRGPAQPLENLIGRTLNHRYLVEDKIGEGGFGAVFRGKQIATGREVALKILHPHNSDETIVARFRREAEACSKLRDPHTVTTYDFDETPDGILYLAMELLRGRALHHLQKAEGPLRARRACCGSSIRSRRRSPRRTPTASSTAT